MDVNMTGFYHWSGMMIFCVWMICSVVYVECHSEVNGCNSCMWSMSSVTYSCDDGVYPYVVIWNGLCRNPGDWSSGVCENLAKTLNSFACLCPNSNVWNLTLHGELSAVWIGEALLGFPKEESYVDNPLQCDHIHCIWNI